MIITKIISQLKIIMSTHFVYYNINDLVYKLKNKFELSKRYVHKSRKQNIFKTNNHYKKLYFLLLKLTAPIHKTKCLTSGPY